MNESLELQRLLASAVASEQQLKDQIKLHLATIETLQAALRRKDEEIKALREGRI